jgi:ABC-type Fe3+/spermidine/putrescine transport system ATPase subunit
MTQANSLFPNITVFENVAYAIRTFEKSYQSKRVNFLCRHFGVHNLLHKYPRELSGGELQRVMLAKVIADEPSVLLLDEPFANIDGINKRKAMVFLEKIIKKENISCLWVTHDMNDAFGFSDRIVVLKNGKIIESNTPSNLYFKPKNAYVAALSGDFFSIEIDGVKKLLRPEQILIKADGRFSSTIEKVNFKAGRFEIIFEYQDQFIFSYYHEPLQMGQIVNFDFNLVS